MSEHGDGPSHDQQADAKPVTLRRVEASEGFEDFRYLLGGNTDPRIEYIDAYAVSHVTAPQKDTATRFRELYRIADQIAENRAEKNGIAHDRGCGGHQSNLNSLLQGGPFILPIDLAQQRSNVYGHHLHALPMLVKTQGVQQLIELFCQSIDGALAQPQQVQFRLCPGAVAEAIVNALDNLERLTKVVTGHGEENPHELTGVRLARWTDHSMPEVGTAGSWQLFPLRLSARELPPQLPSELCAIGMCRRIQCCNAV
ncbi:hypothetical protein ACVJGD_004017 [Bradyrhizobium sp. USDA 10063]